MEGRKANRDSAELESLWELHTDIRIEEHTVTAFPLACGGRAVPQREHLHDLWDRETSQAWEEGMGLSVVGGKGSKTPITEKAGGSSLPLSLKHIQFIDVT